MLLQFPVSLWWLWYPLGPSVSIQEAGQLLTQQQLEFWERALGCESSSLTADSESWWSNVQQTRGSWMRELSAWFEAGARWGRMCQMGQKSRASSQGFLDKAVLNLYQGNLKMPNKGMCDENQNLNPRLALERLPLQRDACPRAAQAGPAAPGSHRYTVHSPRLGVSLKSRNLNVLVMKVWIHY